MIMTGYETGGTGTPEHTASCTKTFCSWPLPCTGSECLAALQLWLHFWRCPCLLFLVRSFMFSLRPVKGIKGAHSAIPRSLFTLLRVAGIFLLSFVRSFRLQCYKGLLAIFSHLHLYVMALLPLDSINFLIFFCPFLTLPRVTP